MNGFLRELRYGPGPRHVGDLYPPDPGPHPAPRAPVLLIHGGGWNALSKESLAPLARLIASEGRHVFNINYRLLSHAPWPACRDDGEAAARFILAGGLAERGLRAPEKLLVCGASAGAHLAMHAGLALGSRACSGVISLAGPSRVAPAAADTEASAIRVPGFLAAFFGASAPPDPARLASASPSALASADAPPLRCIHSRNDRLVPPAHSEEAVAAWHAAGASARLDLFDGPGAMHGFWDGEDLSTRQLAPVLVPVIQAVLRELP